MTLPDSITGTLTDPAVAMACEIIGIAERQLREMEDEGCSPEDRLEFIRAFSKVLGEEIEKWRKGAKPE